MLPPQSGHTQFRMPDITSELTPIAADLIAGISTSMNDKEPSAACPSASDRVHPGGQRSGTEILPAFRIPNIGRRDFRGFSSENGVVQIKVSELSPPASEGAYGNAPRATVAFAVPPPRYFIPLRRRLVPELSCRSPDNLSRVFFNQLN